MQRYHVVTEQCCATPAHYVIAEVKGMLYRIFDNLDLQNVQILQSVPIESDPFFNLYTLSFQSSNLTKVCPRSDLPKYAIFEMN